MQVISGNFLITLVRGDSFTTPIFINCGTKIRPMRYPLSETDIVYVGIMEPNKPFEESLIKKELTIKDLNKYGDPVLRLKPEDTALLAPGTYYYEIKIKGRRYYNDGESGDTKFVDITTTIVNRRKFTIID